MSVLTRLARAQEALPELAAPPQQHRADCGWRRTFLSARDARAYERGYSCWPEPMPADVALSTPFSTGWFDCEHDAMNRDEAKRDAYRLGIDA